MKTHFALSLLSLLVLSVASGAVACGPGEPPPQTPVPVPPPTVTAPPPPADTTPPPPIVRETPDAPFRAQPPAPDGQVTFTAPKVQTFTLKNGARVYLVERHDLPIVSARVVLAAGAGDFPGLRPVAASFTGAMLEQGTTKRDALKLSDDFESIGAAHSAWIEWDSAGASVKVLATKLDEGLEMMSDVVLHPTFPQAEIDRLKARRIAAIQQQKSSPGAIVGNIIPVALYGRTHPYGNPMMGREDDVTKVDRAEIVKTYDRVFNEGNASFVVAGDITEDALKEKLEKYFGGWKKTAGEHAHAAPAPAPRPKDSRVLVFDKPGAAQSQVYLVDVGVAKSSRDRDVLEVMNAILGGMFTSRINLNLREAHAWTYGAHSRFSLRHGAGPFTAGGAIKADHTTDAVKELQKEVRRIRDEPVSADELAEAKEALKLSLPARFESVDAITGSISDLAIYDLPKDEYATRVARIDAVTVADVKRVATALIKPDRMKLVIVGDRKIFSVGLPGLGLGEPESRDAFGDLVK